VPSTPHAGVCWRQESAVYAKQLFENRVSLFGRLVRVRYSEQGNS